MSEYQIATAFLFGIAIPVICVISGIRARAERQRQYRDALRRGDMVEAHRLMGFDDDV